MSKPPDLHDLHKSGQLPAWPMEMCRIASSNSSENPVSDQCGDPAPAIPEPTDAEFPQMIGDSSNGEVQLIAGEPFDLCNQADQIENAAGGCAAGADATELTAQSAVLTERADAPPQMERPKRTPCEWERLIKPFARDRMGLWFVQETAESKTARKTAKEKTPDKVPTPEYDKIELANFPAKIVGEIIESDGEPGSIGRRWYVIDALVDQRSMRIEVLAQDFERLEWVAKYLGANAILVARQKETIRQAIQVLSPPDKPLVTRYLHTGWVKIAGIDTFLFSGGSITCNGKAADAASSLPGELSKYVLPEPPSRRALQDAALAALAVTRLGPRQVGFSLFLFAFLAVIKQPGFTLWLTGATSSFKSQLAAICQQFFGAAMDARSLPANFSSTPNALEQIAFLAKDVVLVVDDFAPYGDSKNAQEFQGKADRLVRGTANRMGRGRLNSDSQAKPTKPPRAAVVVTGECAPDRASVVGRLVILEIQRMDYPSAALTEVQNAASRGAMAATMAAFIYWLSDKLDRIRQRFESVWRNHRNRLSAAEDHARNADNIAELLAAADIFANFGSAALRWTDAEAADFVCDAHTAVGVLAKSQRQHGAHLSPAAAFAAGLRQALASGAGYVTDKAGKEVPQGFTAVSCGWILRGDEFATPTTPRLGHVDGCDLWLLPEIALKCLRTLPGGAALQLDVKTVGKRLAEAGMVSKTEEETRCTVTVRKKFDGVSTQMWSLKAELFLTPSATNLEPDVGAVSKPTIDRW